MTDAEVTVVLVENNKKSEAKAVASYLNQHFPAINIEQIKIEKVASFEYELPVVLFIHLITDELSPWISPVNEHINPLSCAVAYSADKLDPVNVLSNGYFDCVVDSNLEHLRLVVLRHLEQFNFTTKLSSTESEHSDFTGVHSRLQFLEFVSSLTNHEQLSHSAIVYLQLDTFAWMNENLGMAAGDTFLEDVGHSFRSIIKKQDYVARYQGGNFVFYLTADDQKLLSSKADMVRETVHELTTEYENNVLSSSASIGVRLYDPKLKVSDLIENAYDASDIAKTNGGDTVHYYREDSDDSSENLSKKTWYERIKQAFDNDLFILYFQPIVNLVTDSSPRYEVLLRMTDDNQDIISPGTFLPYAERAGLMADIDRKVIYQAMQTVQSEFRNATEQPELFIKLSGKSVDDTTMASWIANTLEELSYPAEKVVFEITESIALHHLVQTRSLCQKLNELGVKVALDHFGTRFKSIKLLDDLTLDYVKIDGTIVQHLENNKGHQAIVKQIVKTSRKRNINLIAESVQEASSLPLIWQHDIPMVQGFFLGVPTEVMDYDFENMLL